MQSLYVIWTKWYGWIGAKTKRGRRNLMANGSSNLPTRSPNQLLFLELSSYIQTCVSAPPPDNFQGSESGCPTCERLCDHGCIRRLHLLTSLLRYQARLDAHVVKFDWRIPLRTSLYPSGVYVLWNQTVTRPSRPMSRPVFRGRI